MCAAMIKLFCFSQSLSCVLQDEDGDSVYSQARYRLPVPLGEVTVVRI